MLGPTTTRKICEYLRAQPVLRAYVFGSYSRNEETQDSDIDLLVELDRSRPIGLQFFGMAADLEDITGKKVDLVVDGTLLPFASETANRDKKLIYERGGA